VCTCGTHPPQRPRQIRQNKQEKGDLHLDFAQGMDAVSRLAFIENVRAAIPTIWHRRAAGD